MAITTRQALVRNFCIIAHIDHGKSTLADRLLELTGSISKRDMMDQVLDTMDLERERGITIKLQPVRMSYAAPDGRTYELNLIDTPGHVDFSYEVSRSLAACEGAILVVAGTREILDAVVREVPAPNGDAHAPLRALIFDSHYDPYRGVIVYVRVVDGEIGRGTGVRMMATNRVHEVDEVGWFAPRERKGESLSVGEVGYFTAAIKNVVDARVGDTVTLAEHGARQALPGYRAVKPMGFAGLFPTDPDLYQDLKEALERLQRNDAALVH